MNTRAKPGPGTKMKRLSLGFQTFSKLIAGNRLYVDKTRHIYDLLTGSGQYFFLSRPRRFGKSLLISTLADIFSGNKEVFKGLWIYDRIQWTKYPVIHIDFSTIDYETPESLKESLKKFLDETAISYGLILDEEKSYKESFVELIRKCSSKGKVVVLIDEYDKPLIEYMETNEIEKAEKIRRVLKNFYGVIKGSDAFLRFVFITGVSKFSKVSVFSDLNNLIDLTLSEGFSTLLGYTEAELAHYFSPYMEQMSEKQGMSKNRLLEKIQKWYNGYSWDGKNFVYNPYSILNLFNENSFENFWFASGTPTFLVKVIKNKEEDAKRFDNLTVSRDAFEKFDIENMEISSLLFQTGYLTIKKIYYIRDDKKRYQLSYPNQEVRDSFLNVLFQEYTQKSTQRTSEIVDRMAAAIAEDNIDLLIEQFKSLFASIPYNIFIGEREAYYHTVIYFVLKLIGAEVRPEEESNIGRLDAVLETNNKIYIMEFKLGSGQEALEQIKEMKYAEKYRTKGKEIVLAGIGFDSEKRNIDTYLLERLTPDEIM
jgi:hypothetical protein